MNLVIDIGNTQVKTALFKENKLFKKETFSKNEIVKSLKNISNNYIISKAILSNVSNIDELILNKIKKLFEIIQLNYNTKVPFNNFYKTPQTLGVDRIALVAAAVNQFPNKNVLIFDAGSCITYDFVNTKKDYFGGAISPGIAMRYESIHKLTANLPKLSAIDKIPKIGNSTKKAIHLGILNGVIQEIEGVINQYKVKNKKLTVVLTGGDTIFLAKNLKSTIFANPNFLLEGLNSILIYNKNT